MSFTSLSFANYIENSNENSNSNYLENSNECLKAKRDVFPLIGQAIIKWQIKFCKDMPVL